MRASRTTQTPNWCSPKDFVYLIKSIHEEKGGKIQNFYFGSFWDCYIVIYANTEVLCIVNFCGFADCYIAIYVNTDILCTVNFRAMSCNLSLTDVMWRFLVFLFLLINLGDDHASLWRSGLRLNSGGCLGLALINGYLVINN